MDWINSAWSGVSTAANGVQYGVTTAASGVKYGITTAASGVHYGVTTAASGIKFGVTTVGSGVKSGVSTVANEFADKSCNKCKDMETHFNFYRIFALTSLSGFTVILIIFGTWFAKKKLLKSAASNYEFKSHQLIQITIPNIKPKSLRVLAQTCKMIAPEYTNNENVEVEIKDGNILNIYCEFKKDQDLKAFDIKIQNIIRQMK